MEPKCWWFVSPDLFSYNDQRLNYRIRSQLFVIWNLWDHLLENFNNTNLNNIRLLSFASIKQIKTQNCCSTVHKSMKRKEENFLASTYFLTAIKNLKFPPTVTFSAMLWPYHGTDGLINILAVNSMGVRSIFLKLWLSMCLRLEAVSW